MVKTDKFSPDCVERQTFQKYSGIQKLLSGTVLGNKDARCGFEIFTRGAQVKVDAYPTPISCGWGRGGDDCTVVDTHSSRMTHPSTCCTTPHCSHSLHRVTSSTILECFLSCNTTQSNAVSKRNSCV